MYDVIHLLMLFIYTFDDTYRLYFIKCFDVLSVTKNYPMYLHMDHMFYIVCRLGYVKLLTVFQCSKRKLKKKKNRIHFFFFLNIYRI